MVTPPPLDIVIIGAEYDSAGNGSLELKVGASGSKFGASLTKTDFDWGHLTVSKDGGAFASFGPELIDSVSVDGTTGNLTINFASTIANLDGLNDEIKISTNFVTKAGEAQVAPVDVAMPIAGGTPPPLDIVIIGAEYDSAGNGSLELKVGASGSKFGNHSQKLILTGVI